jgi:hypothetical protein
VSDDRSDRRKILDEMTADAAADDAYRTVNSEPAPDGDLPGTLRHLGDAISRLCDPKPQTVGGSIHWVESFYQQLCDAIPGSQGTRSAVPQSSPD